MTQRNSAISCSVVHDALEAGNDGVHHLGNQGSRLILARAVVEFCGRDSGHVPGCALLELILQVCASCAARVRSIEYWSFGELF